jgi:hypothetical protein
MENMRREVGLTEEEVNKFLYRINRFDKCCAGPSKEEVTEFLSKNYILKGAYKYLKGNQLSDAGAASSLTGVVLLPPQKEH